MNAAMFGMIMPLRNVPNFCTPSRTDCPVLRVGDVVVMGVVLLSWWWRACCGPPCCG